MRIVVAIILLLSVSFNSTAQVKIPEVDKSPLDMAYYPDNYPLLKIQDKTTEPMMARVVYSRPQKSGRVIFGGLIEYGKVWRLGANEATEIEFFQNIKINNVKIKKGRYTLYAIPYETKWTFILNKETDTWGSFRYDEKKDVLRMDIPVQKQTQTAETFSLMFEKMNGGFMLNALWDNAKTSLPVYLQ